MKETISLPSQLLPHPIKKGDAIGLILPAGPIQNEDNFISGIRLIKELGFKVKFSHEKRNNAEGYLAGNDQDRAQDLNELWADPEVKALQAVRGGYGSLRMVDYINLEIIRQNPKILIGFSDVTVLLNSIWKNTGLITFHGPVVTTLNLCDQEFIQVYFDTLTGHFPNNVKPDQLEILKPGMAHGRLLGGNLATIASLLATPHEIIWADTILFIEDTCETPYRVDRILTQLMLAQRLNGLKGLILGTFTTDSNDKCLNDYSEPIWNRVLALLADYNIPVWANFPVGHANRNHVLPLGIEVEMDSDNGILNFCGSCTC